MFFPSYSTPAKRILLKELIHKQNKHLNNSTHDVVIAVNTDESHFKESNTEERS